MDEADFHQIVIEYFEDTLDCPDITHEPTLDETGRVVDLLIDDDPFTYAVEVENGFETAIGGTGQALLYAQHAPADEHWIPVVVVPEGTPEQPEWDMMKNVVTGIEV
jgi:hypothetical protein